MRSPRKFDHAWGPSRESVSFFNGGYLVLRMPGEVHRIEQGVSRYHKKPLIVRLRPSNAGFSIFHVLRPCMHARCNHGSQAYEARKFAEFIWFLQSERVLVFSSSSYDFTCLFMFRVFSHFAWLLSLLLPALALSRDTSSFGLTIAFRHAHI